MVWWGLQKFLDEEYSHTFRFNLINSSLEVIEVYFDARPFSEKLIRSEKRAKFVLELNVGVFKELGFDIGDRIIF